MFCPGNCAGRGTCVFDHTDGDGIPRPKCQCFDETDESAGCSDSFVLDGKYLKDGTGLSDTIQSNFFEPLIAVFVDHPDFARSGDVHVDVPLETMGSHEVKLARGREGAPLAGLE